MDTVERLYSSYGEMAPRGQARSVANRSAGQRLLENHFARLDYINKSHDSVI